jgi:hypothetical protein
MSQSPRPAGIGRNLPLRADLEQGMTDAMKRFTWKLPVRFALALFAAVCAQSTFGGAAAAPAAVAPAEKLLPADTLFVVTVPDCARMSAILAKSPQSQFWNDPAMKPFRDKFTAKWKDEFVTPLERDLGVKFDNYAALPQGLLTFAVIQDGWNGIDDQLPGLLLLLDTKDKSGQLKTNLADLRKKWVDAGKPIRTEKIRGVEFSIAPLSSNDVPRTLTELLPQRQEVQERGREPKADNPSSKNELVIGQFESLLIVGSSTKTVEKVVAHLTGGSAPALCDQSSFEANRLALFRDALLYGWLNAKALFDTLARVPPEKPNPEAPSPLPAIQPIKILSALGLTGLKTVAFDFRDSGDGSSFELFLGAPESARQGFFKLLSAEAKDASLPAFVPADAVTFRRWRIDGQKAVAAFEKMIGDLSPEAISSWNFMIKNINERAQQDDPAYNIRKSLFANLGDDIITYGKAPRGSSLAELQSPPSLLLIASPAAEKMAAALNGPWMLLSQTDPPDVREFLGRKIYTVTQPSLPFVTTVRRTPRKLSYAASGGYVAFSTDAAMVEEFLRSSDSQAKTLRDTPGLADAAQKAGGAGAGWFGYNNLAENWRVFFAALKQNSGTETNSGTFNPLTESIPFAPPEKSLKEWLDFSLLPPFERVAKYFSFSVTSGSATADGLTFKLFTPLPPQLKK